MPLSSPYDSERLPAPQTRPAQGLGTVSLGAHQIAFQLWSFLALSLDSIAIAAQAMVGRLLGAGDADGARSASRRMVEWGLPPLSALQAATSNAAALLRLSEVGTVDQGKAADLVLFDGDPLDDIGLVLKPALVMRAGRRVD